MDTTLLEIPSPVLPREATNAQLGRWGEDLAVSHLRNQGYEILERNWRCRRGELDILAAHPKRGVVAIEVKTRRSSSFVQAPEAISYEKLSRLRRLFGQWLQDKDVHAPRIGIDLIAVTVEPSGAWLIRHIEDIW